MYLTPRELEILAAIRACAMPMAAEQIMIEYKEELDKKARSFYAHDMEKCISALERIRDIAECTGCPALAKIAREALTI